MAPRTVKIRHDEETRAKIQASQLINRLQSHVFEDVEISATQMKAIEILLRKSLPDLTSVTIDGDLEVALKPLVRQCVDPGREGTDR